MAMFSDRMSSPPIPVPASRHSAYESLSHSHPNDSGNKPVLSPGTANKHSGVVSWLDNSAKADHPSPDKLHTPDTDKLTRKESYKAQRKNYCREKKRVANELLSSLKDPSVIVLADWLKVRGTLKSWTKLWCILKPGLLLLYKSPKAKSNHWVGTILLNTCQVIERPSKKDGFCFKLFHPLEQSIWAPRGPEKETIGAVVQPLPTAYLIFRAPSQAAGKCWLDALELALRCSSLLVRSMSSKSSGVQDTTANHETQWSEADYEKHFTDHVDALPSIGRLLKSFCPKSPLTPHSKNLLSTAACSSHSSPTPTDIHLLPPVTGLSPCPSPTPFFQQLYHAVAYMEQELGDSPSHVCSSPYPDSSQHDSRPCSAFSYNESPIHLASTSKHATECDILQVSVPLSCKSSDSSQVTLVPSPDHTDLDDISQPDVGGVGDHLSGAEQGSLSDSESEASVKKEGQHEMEGEPLETPYIHHGEVEEFGSAGEQVEELPEEHKSLIWYLVKQVRPGMDLSKVVLPTFILEPRSFLDKLSDSYYHADILSKAVLEDDAFTRMKGIVKWYLSGFYKKPKGLKKPYNPILGETFRCYWKHPNGSRTFYLSEQVSHHPPVSAFYVTNRQDGFCISASILAKSKFYGNSTSAILDGVALLTLLPRGEDYSITIPYAHCKGILMGTLTMELGGKVIIDCEKTGYKTEIEFKLKPFLGGAEQTNAISGRLKLGKETLATIDGYWDGSIFIKDRRTGEEQLFWKPTPEVRAQRLKRFTVSVDQQGEFESEHLWQHVSAAIARDDQVAATEEKTALEEAQRAAAKERKMKCVEWIPKYFEQDLISGQWVYKHADLRPWDPRNDVCQYEYNYIIQTKTRHQTPMIRTASIVSVDPQTVVPLLQTESRSSISALKSSKHHLSSKVATVERQDSASSSPDGEFHSDSSQSEENESRSRSHVCCRTNSRLNESVANLEATLKDHGDKLMRIQRGLEHLAKVQREKGAEKIVSSFSFSHELVLTVVMVVVLQSLLTWLFCRK
ncbi:oxysterol-binding protein-related protein 8 isoform X3 [Periplaneta americana]|uniref:oxysterol-binding protein-related protein 8 isoform X3 n=1 Tax=Periplaneta americana TaxID=6978 RepID=UPI0037E8C8BC